MRRGFHRPSLASQHVDSSGWFQTDQLELASSSEIAHIREVPARLGAFPHQDIDRQATRSVDLPSDCRWDNGG
ncbi:hypothetical protein GC176_07565 [bacterium]|nr:hypothetical protein [bacterium]